MTPTQRSLKHLRDAGYLVEVVERWNPWVKIRHDLFGFVDLLAVRPDETLAVQTTTASNMSARIKKILALPSLGKVVDAGWTIRVHGWKKPGKKVRTWTLKTVDIASGGFIHRGLE